MNLITFALAIAGALTIESPIGAVLILAAVVSSRWAG